MAQSQSYSQSQLAQSYDFAGRIASILKDEGHSPVGQDAYVQAVSIAADVAAQPGLSESVHSAVVAGRDDWATADDVITDAVLLGAVTEVIAAVRASG
jgi:hypothetical protein